MHVPSGSDDSCTWKEIVRVAHRRGSLRDDIPAPGTNSFQSPDGPAVLSSEGLFQITIGGCQVLWSSDSAREIKLRLMICSDTREPDHRMIVATLVRLRAYGWRNLVSDLNDSVMQISLLRLSRWRGVLRPYGEMANESVPNDLVPFDIFTLVIMF